MATLNFGDVPDARDFAPVPEGDYDLVVASAVDGYTGGGDDMVTMTLEVVGGKYDGRRVWDRLVMSQKALPRVKLFLQAAGVSLDGDVEVDADSVVGLVVGARVEKDGYRDGDGKWVDTNSIGFAGYHAPTDREAAQKASEDALARNERAASSAPEPADDEIPFVVALPFLVTGLISLMA